MENIDEDIKIVEEYLTENRDWKCIECGFNCSNEVQAIENLLSRLKTAERMIELMAEEMKTKEYEYENMCLYSEDCHGEYCEKCIIEYFRNKAKESE